MSGYYAEDPDILPFDIAVRLYQQSLPYPLAFLAVVWRRFWHRREILPMPISASRWQEELVWDERNDMPAKALARWAPKLEKLDDLGFEICSWILSDTIGAKEEANVYLRSECGTVFAQLLWMQTNGIEQIRISMISYPADGTEIITSAAPRHERLLVDSLVPDFVHLKCMPLRTQIDGLLNHHKDRTDQREILTLTASEFEEHFAKQRLRLFEYFVSSGAIRKLTHDEIMYLTGRE